uniref:Uncharacterized protein n=1 Tax=Romanomermis culicivorax TaxID=13658 RepID=A0A915JGS2_ROMCU
MNISALNFEINNLEYKYANVPTKNNETTAQEEFVSREVKVFPTNTQTTEDTKLFVSKCKEDEFEYFTDSEHFLQVRLITGEKKDRRTRKANMSKLEY